MAGMRDRLIHGYREVDVDLIWLTATRATLEAEEGVKLLLDSLDDEEG